MTKATTKKAPTTPVPHNCYFAQYDGATDRHVEYIISPTAKIAQQYSRDVSELNHLSLTKFKRWDGDTPTSAMLKDNEQIVFI